MPEPWFLLSMVILDGGDSPVSDGRDGRTDESKFINHLSSGEDGGHGLFIDTGGSTNRCVCASLIVSVNAPMSAPHASVDS